MARRSGSAACVLLAVTLGASACARGSGDRTSRDASGIAWGESSGGLRIGVEASVARIEAGEPVRLCFRLRNESDSDLVLWGAENPSPRNWRFEIRAAGRSEAFLLEHPGLPETPAPPLPFVILSREERGLPARIGTRDGKHGETAGAPRDDPEVLLPGRYTVTVRFEQGDYAEAFSRRGRESGEIAPQEVLWKGRVSSGPVEFEVAPRREGPAGGITEVPWGDEAGGVRVRLTPRDGNEFRKGRPCSLAVEVRNTSGKPIYFAGPSAFRVQAGEADGHRPVSPIRVRWDPFSAGGIELPAGQTSTWLEFLERLGFGEPLKPGAVLTLRIRGFVADGPATLGKNPKWTEVSSNPVTIRLKDGLPALLDEAAGLLDRWSDSYELVCREDTPLRGFRFLQVSSAGPSRRTGNVLVRHMDERNGAFSARVGRERLDRLVRLIRAHRIAERSTQRQEPPYPDEPFLSFCLSAPGASITAVFPGHAIEKDPALGEIRAAIRGLVGEVLGTGVGDSGEAEPAGGKDSWTSVSGTGLGRSITAFWFVDERQGWLATGDGSLLRTNDGGDTWRSLRLPPSEGESDRVAELRLLPGRGGACFGLAATRARKVLATADGETWTRLDAPRRRPETRPAAGPGVSWLQAAAGLWFTSDEGRTWVLAAKAEFPREFGDPVFPRVHFRSPTEAVALRCTGEDLRLARSSDGGKTWTLAERAWRADGTRRLTFLDAPDGVRVYLGEELLLESEGFSAEDEAVKRVLRRSLPDDRIVESERRTQIAGNGFLVQVESVWWDSSSYESLQVSRDGGRTWQRKYLSTGLTNLQFVDERHGLAVGYGGRVSRTADGGESWIHTFLPTQSDFKAVFLLDRDTGWIGGGVTERGSIWQTRDGGASWKKLSTVEGGRSGKHAYPETIRGLTFRDAQEGWAVTHGASAEAHPEVNGSTPLEYGRILYTRDGGNAWTQVYYGTPLSSIASRDGTFVATGYGLVRSEDGENWENIRAPSPMFGVAFPDARRVVAVGEQADCYVSEDAGRTWGSVRGAAFARTHLDVVAFADPRVGWMGGSMDPDQTHRGLFKTVDGGKTWTPCEMGREPGWGTGGVEGWKGLSVVDAQHAWIAGRYAVARLTRR